MKLDQEARYTKDHEWVRWYKAEEKKVVCGITDHAQASLSDVVYVELPEAGDEFDQGEIFGVVESVKAASDLFMPMSGEIVAINERLDEAPELVNQGPYDAGWMIRILPSDPSEFEGLMTAADYEEMFSEDED
jgi:glycine cleavage system H protein